MRHAFIHKHRASERVKRPQETHWRGKWAERVRERECKTPLLPNAKVTQTNTQ